MKIQIINCSKAVLTISLFVVGLLGAGELSGTINCKGARTNAGAVVYLEYIDGEFSPPEEPIDMDQKDLKFIPHILPITEGSTVNFINNDDVLHNVFSPDKCATNFNLGTWPKGETRSHTFENEGCYSVVLCNVHPEMEAWILVLQNPYFAVTDEKGEYNIKDIPAGSYSLVAWHERLKNKSQKVEITDDGITSVDFVLSRR